jgi:dihydroxyacetone kinase
VRTTLVRAGAAWSDAAGGTSGALWGAALTAAGGALSDTDVPTPAQVVGAAEEACSAVLRLGGARPGDKTVVDALVPFAEALRDSHDSGADLADAWQLASAAADRAAAETATLTARLGRARSHGERSVGHPDPGATSFALLMAAARDGVRSTPTS